MNRYTRSICLTLALGLGALLPPAADAQIGVETVKLGYQDANTTGTLTIVPLEHPQNATDPTPYRAQFVMDKGDLAGTGAGIYQYLPASKNYLLAFAMPAARRVLFFQCRTSADPNNTGIVGGGPSSRWTTRNRPSRGSSPRSLPRPRARRRSRQANC